MSCATPVCDFTSAVIFQLRSEHHTVLNWPQSHRRIAALLKKVLTLFEAMTKGGTYRTTNDSPVGTYARLQKRRPSARATCEHQLPRNCCCILWLVAPPSICRHCLQVILLDLFPLRRVHMMTVVHSYNPAQPPHLKFSWLATLAPPYHVTGSIHSLWDFDMDTIWEM
jgi:hypothetical protein